MVKRSRPLLCAITPTQAAPAIFLQDKSNMSTTKPSYIPASNALIGWNTNKAFRVVDVFVLPDGRGKDWKLTGIPADWDGADFTHGACFAAWMKGTRDMTPEFVFSEILVFHGFADSQVAEKAIAEFAKIKECAWARAMVPTQATPKIFWKAE